MDKYGLTEKEKQMNLHNYNHALFRNMMCFMHFVWEINIVTKTVVVIEDRNMPEVANTEFTFDEIFQRYLEKYVDEKDKDVFRGYLSFDHLEHLKEEVSFDLHLRLGGNEPELHNVVLTPAFDDDGQIECVYVGARNIQLEIRKEYEEYRRQEQFLRVLLTNSYFHFAFDLTGDGMITEDYVTRDGHHLIQELTQLQMPVSFEVFIRNWVEICQPQLRDEREKEIFTIAYLKEAFRRNEHLIELEVKQKDLEDGDMDSIMQIFIVMMKRPEEQHVRVYFIWMDISLFQRETMKDNIELKNSNADLRRSLDQEQQYRRAAQSDALLVYNINLTRNIIEDEIYEIVDGKRIPMLELVGLKAPCRFDELCKRWCEARVSEESKETFAERFNRRYMLDMYAEGERHLEIEYDTVLGMDERVTLRNTTFLLEDEDTGDIIAVVSSRDVSMQRAEEKRRRETLRDAYKAANSANSAKTDFLARMSHDIRTPMNVIIGMTAIASRHLDDPDRVSECLKEISTSGKYLLDILSEVLDMSKIESGKLELQKTRFDIGVLFDNISTLCIFQCKEKNHEFSVELQDLTHKKVIGDPQRLQQALMNLIDNAIKYTPDGGRISLTVTEQKTNRTNVGCYEVILRDNGIGMEPEYIEHLFEPFVRSEDKRVAKIQGTGLGLPIAKNIVQMMNGTINVESRLDEGTTIRVIVFLKLEKQEEKTGDKQEPMRGAPLEALANKNYRGKRALLAEDSKSNADIEKDILAVTGLEVEHVWDGKQAVERIQEVEDGYYDIVFMDIQMPNMNGNEAAKAIRAMDRGYTKQLPIIAMSANAFAEDVLESKACGMNEHLAKPIDFKELAKNLDLFLT